MKHWAIFLILGLLNCTSKPSIGDRVELVSEIEVLDKLNIPYGVTFAVGENGDKSFDSLNFLNDSLYKIRFLSESIDLKAEVERFESHPRFFKELPNHTEATILDIRGYFVKVKALHRDIYPWWHEVGWVYSSNVKRY